MAGGLETVPINEGDATSGFHSGVAPLDAYFAKHAVENDRRGIGKTFVLKRPEAVSDLPAILGYYTLSMADVEGAKLPKKISRGLPAYPIPVALIGRLAVDERARSRGFGARLLRDALLRVAMVSQQIACFGVVVDAKDAAALRFYEKFGLTPLGSESFPRRLFVSMKLILEASSS